MRASHIQSELIEAIDAGASIYGPIHGPFQGPLTAEDQEVAAFFKAVVSYVIAPRLAAFDPADYFGETIDPNFEIHLFTQAGHALPVGIGMTNWRVSKTIQVFWEKQSVWIEGEAISLASSDARQDVIHALAWAVANFFGEEDE